MAQSKPGEAKVGKYAERPLEDALADPKDIAAVEDRPTEDQIKDYHEKNPTLKVKKAVEKAVEEQHEGQPSN